jgi:hypothetical protein
MSSGFAAAVEPVSGFIATSEYGTDKDGEAVGQKRTNRIWFQGHNSRTELLIGENLADVTVKGDHPWVGAPAAGRLLIMNKPADGESVPPPTYPEIVRRDFARSFAKYSKTGTEDIKNVHCWKYTFFDKGMQIGCIRTGDQDMTYWIYSDAEFPFALARKSSTGGARELVEFRLNAPVPPDTFTMIPGLKPVLPFHLPTGKFLLQMEEDRQSNQYHWKTHSIEIFEGDGDAVTKTFSSSHEQNEKTTTFKPPATRLSYQQASAELANRLQNPMWMSVRKTGAARTLDMTTDVLEKIEGAPEEKSCVADHPLLGTICLHRTSISPEENREWIVTRLEVDGQRERE